MTQKMTIYNTERCFLSMHGGYHRKSRQRSPLDNTHSVLCSYRYQTRTQIAIPQTTQTCHKSISTNHVECTRCPQHGVSVTVRSFLLMSVRKKWQVSFQVSFSLAASSDVARIPNRLNLLDGREQSGAGRFPTYSILSLAQSSKVAFIDIFDNFHSSWSLVSVTHRMNYPIRFHVITSVSYIKKKKAKQVHTQQG